MSQDPRARLKEWLQSGEIRLQPLTFPQRELWEASPVPAADVSNNICAMIHIRGRLTPEGGEAALQKVVDRQEVFRMSILPGKGQPMQLIRKSGRTALRFSELPASQRSAEAIEERAGEIFHAPFDLVQGPLYRAEVFRLAADDHVLAFAIHHAIADGWTLGVFVQDLFTAYLHVVKGLTTALPPVPLSYSDWGAAERAFWQPAELAQRAAFWQANLAGAPRLWSPPSDSAATSAKLDRWAIAVPPELGRALRELARRQGATLFTTLLTAFQLTLAQWTGSDDIVVGTPVANRGRQGVSETMGYCSGIVPLRGHVDPTRSFSNSLRAVHLATVDAFANAMPFAELVRAVGGAQDASATVDRASCPESCLPSNVLNLTALGGAPAPGTNPVFEVRFALQNHPVPDVETPGLSLKLRMRSTGTARFAIACEICEEGDALEVAWLFRPQQFPLADIQNLGRMYIAALAGVCRNPENSTSTLMTNLQ